MNNNIKGIIFVFSKYSISCKNLYDLIFPKYKDLFKWKFLCVDNKDIKDKIENSTTITLEEVPSLIVVYDTNETNVGVFQGILAMQWIEENVLPLYKPLQSTSISTISTEEDKDQFGGRYTNKNYPNKGEGHNNMAQSSLSSIEENSPPPQYEEEPNQNSPLKPDKEETENLMMSASDMQKEREEEESKLQNANKR